MASGALAARLRPLPPPFPANDNGWPSAIAGAARSLGPAGIGIAGARALDAFLADDGDGWRWWRAIADCLGAHDRLARRIARAAPRLPGNAAPASPDRAPERATG